MSTAELLLRLRSQSWYDTSASIRTEAADTIERLAVEVAELRSKQLQTEAEINALVCDVTRLMAFVRTLTRPPDG